MSVGEINHTEQGLGQIPEKLRQNRIQRFLSVYLKQFDDVEGLYQDFINNFLAWESGGTLDFVLETIGAFFDQPRPDGFSNAQYTFLIGGRLRSRRSVSNRDSVFAVAQYLARDGSVEIFFFAPKIVLVVFGDVFPTEQERELFRSVLLDSVDAVDELAILYLSASLEGYDVGEYDDVLYAP